MEAAEDEATSDADAYVDADEEKFALAQKLQPRKVYAQT